MAWTAPKTWTNAVLTAADLNTHVRDNLNAAIPVTSTITTTGTQTALAIPAGRGDLVIFANNASTLTLQGITAAQNGQSLTIVSIGAGNVAIAHQNTSASAANRVVNQVTGTITLAAGKGSVTMVYDSTSSRWRVMNHDQGAWITPSYSAGDFSANGSMTWGVDAADISTYAYMITGRVMTVIWYIGASDVGGTASTALLLKIPNGLTAGKTVMNPFIYSDAAGSNTVGFAQVTSGSINIELWRLNAAVWTLTSGDNTAVYGQTTFEVA